MQAWWLIVLTSTACEKTLDDRLAELDDNVAIDCGEVWPSATREEPDLVIACMRDNLAADVRAKAFFVLNIDFVAYVYTIDGSYMNIEGVSDHVHGDQFTESRCQDVAVVDDGPGFKARAIDCESIRDW